MPTNIIRRLNADLGNNAGLGFRQPSTAYAVGDLAWCTALPAGWFLECTAAGTTAAGALTFNAPTVGATIVDGTVSWTIRSVGGDTLPVGTLVPFAGAGALPAGFLACDGSAVSRSMYPDLFAVIGTAYGAGDGETTFNLPDLRGRFAEGVEVSDTPGVYRAAGLPNIKGTVRVTSVNYTIPYVREATGAFTCTGYQTIHYATDDASRTQTYPQTMAFNASNSNSIYGNSDTVQPASLTVHWLIKAFHGTTAASALADLTQVAQDLARRLTREATPAFNHRDVVTASGTYAAPVTGWYRVSIKGGGGGGNGGYTSSSVAIAGHGGSEGGLTIEHVYMAVGTEVTVVVGAGGAGGTKSTTSSSSVGGTAGGASSVTIDGTTYTAGGGATSAGAGGSGTIRGARGGFRQFGTVTGNTYNGGVGAGHGAGMGGNGGSALVGSTIANGGAGSDGVVWFEWFDPTP